VTSLDLEPIGYHKWSGQAEDGYPTYRTPVYRCPTCGKTFGLTIDHTEDRPGFRWPTYNTPLHADCCRAQIGFIDLGHDKAYFDIGMEPDKDLGEEDINDMENNT
jgi:hypothetical protein